MPSDEDLAGLARVFEVPVNAFNAVRLLDAMEAGPMMATIGAWRYMIDCRSTRLLVVGMTMLAGLIHLRDVSLDGVTLVVSVMDPLADSPHRPNGPAVEGLRSYWQSLYLTLKELHLRPASPHVRLWVHPGLDVPVGGNSSLIRAGQVVANDWVGITSGPAIEVPSFTACLAGEASWQRVVQPLMDELANADDVREHTLVWDSAWTRGDPRLGRLRERLEVVAGTLTPNRLMP